MRASFGLQPNSSILLENLTPEQHRNRSACLGGRRAYDPVLRSIRTIAECSPHTLWLRERKKSWLPRKFDSFPRSTDFVATDSRQASSCYEPKLSVLR